MSTPLNTPRRLSYGKFKVKPSTRVKRTKHGCFCCRKRKIKCDGTRPSCHNCLRSSYLCVWPDGTQSLPHNSAFKLTKLQCRNLRFVDINCSRVKDSNGIHTLSEVDEPSTEDSKIPRDLEDVTRGAVEEVTRPGSPFAEIFTPGVAELSPFFLNETSKALELSSSTSSTMSTTTLCVGSSKSQKETEFTEDALFRRYIQEVNEESGPTILLNGYNTWLPGVSLTSEEAFFYDAFAKGFMVSVSPQLAHRNLQPGAIFIPPGSDNPILRSVFYACGAAFLCWKREDMNQVAEAKFEQCLDMLGAFIEDYSIIGNEYWLLVALLCFCLREKYHSEDVTLNTCHLAAALEIIRIWQANKRNKPNLFKSICSQKPLAISRKLQDSTSDDYPSLDDENGTKGTLQRAKSRNAAIFNRLLEKLRPQFLEAGKEMEERTKDPLPEEAPLTVTDVTSRFNPSDQSVDASERTLLESFLYNYTINLFVCDKEALEYLASPFEVFKAFRDFLSPQIYDCPVPWMNNPVMGASLPAFEIAAKTNWLALQYPLSESSRKTALSLLKSAKYYARPILPADIKAREPENVQRRLMESCYMGEMVAKASFIFLKKLLCPEITGYDPEILNAVEGFNRALYQLTLHSQVGSIASWPIAVAGSAATKKEHRDYLMWRVQSFCDVVRAETMPAIITYLKSIWGQQEDGTRVGGPGMDALIDRKYRKHLFV